MLREIAAAFLGSALAIVVVGPCVLSVWWRLSFGVWPQDIEVTED